MRGSQGTRTGLGLHAGAGRLTPYAGLFRLGDKPRLARTPAPWIQGPRGGRAPPLPGLPLPLRCLLPHVSRLGRKRTARWDPRPAPPTPPQSRRPTCSGPMNPSVSRIPTSSPASRQPPDLPPSGHRSRSPRTSVCPPATPVVPPLPPDKLLLAHRFPFHALVSSPVPPSSGTPQNSLFQHPCPPPGLMLWGSLARCPQLPPFSASRAPCALCAPRMPSAPHSARLSRGRRPPALRGLPWPTSQLGSRRTISWFYP